MDKGGKNGTRSIQQSRHNDAEYDVLTSRKRKCLCADGWGKRDIFSIGTKSVALPPLFETGMDKNEIEDRTQWPLLSFLLILFFCAINFQWKCLLPAAWFIRWGEEICFLNWTRSTADADQEKLKRLTKHICIYAKCHFTVHVLSLAPIFHPSSKCLAYKTPRKKFSYSQVKLYWILVFFFFFSHCCSRTLRTKITTW